MTNKQEVEIIEGEVTQAYPPTKNPDTGKWRPANIYIATSEGAIKVAEFPKSNFDTRITYEPIQMPSWYTALDIDNLAGSQVQVVAVYKETREGTKEYFKTQTFKILDGVTKAQPNSGSSAAPTPTTWGSLDERIAWNSAVNNAVSVIPHDLWFDGNGVRVVIGGPVDVLAHELYALIRRGPTPPVEDAPDDDQPNLDDDPDESLGVLSAEGDDAN